MPSQIERRKLSLPGDVLYVLDKYFLYIRLFGKKLKSSLPSKKLILCSKFVYRYTFLNLVAFLSDLYIIKAISTWFCGKNYKVLLPSIMPDTIIFRIKNPYWNIMICKANTPLIPSKIKYG